MLNKGSTEDRLSGTKAETLAALESQGYEVPPTYFFSVSEWLANSEKEIATILKKYGGQSLAIRSSTRAEDTADSSMAGAFESLLNVDCDSERVKTAVNEVIASFDDDSTNQVLVQPMVRNVAMSGVLMTQVLDDGSPYYVINYDDRSGLTDTVTSGNSINKTVYVYNGVDEKDFDSPFLLTLLRLTKRLQVTFPNIPLDVEFAIDRDVQTHLLQVRKITTINNWKEEVIANVSSRMTQLKEYVQDLMGERPYIYGKTTLLGFMPDWNPAEMIGVVPRPMALSLYRKLITQSTWRIAREDMGYRKMPNVELMVSLFGRVYIDVRNSINSFIPSGLSPEISIKIVNAYLQRLDENPHLHDKIEFEVVHTAFDFDFDTTFSERYGDKLSKGEISEYRSLLIDLTQQAMRLDEGGSLKSALKDIEHLRSKQDAKFNFSNKTSFRLADKINTLIDECINYGTRPFSILARHGFIAEGLLRSASNKGVISSDRLQQFRRGIRTVASDMSEDFFKATNQETLQTDYIQKYGHLRPSSYDILSPNYANRSNLFDGAPKESTHSVEAFLWTETEKNELNRLLTTLKIDISAEDLFLYCEEAIVGREYAKFVFTKHLSEILELAAEWGEFHDFGRDEMSMLTIDDILHQLSSPLTHTTKDFYDHKIENSKHNFDVASSFKLSYLIRSVRDVHIVPMQRSAANYIGDKRIEADVVHLTPYTKGTVVLENKIVCIEGADPGYDWIFTRNIAGLITKYGGTNSHMAIRSAEYGIAAAIGCGDQPFKRIVKAGSCLLDCQGKRLEPIEL